MVPVIPLVQVHTITVALEMPTRLVCSHLKLVECCFMSKKTIGLLGTGAQDGHLDFHTAPEL